MDQRLRLTDVLIANLRQQYEHLASLLATVSSDHTYEDLIYRFYHQSFKVYHLQEGTKAIVEALATLAPEEKAFCGEFREIVKRGTEMAFTMEANQNWLAETTPIVEAFFHAHYFLQMAVKYGREFETAPQVLPSGFAALLCLFEIR
jgi:hypothetical protein